MFDHRAGFGVHMIKSHRDLRVGDGAARNSLVHIAVIGHDKVEHRPALQRIMHDMALRPGPERRGVHPQVFGHDRARDHRTIGRVARHHRLAIGQHLRPNGRAQPLRPDQGAARDLRLIAAVQCDAGAILRIAGDGMVRADFEQPAVAAPLQQKLMQLGPMNDRIRVAEIRSKIGLQRDAGDLFGAFGIHQAQGVDEHRRLAHLRPDPKRIKAMKAVGPDLNACADLAQLAGLLQHDGRDAFPGQRRRRRQSADPAACNEYCVVHGVSVP